ncbi:SH3 domain-containing protein [Caloramator sp. mosi_1]|uniref:SH3 domain-containing protein n=1 Tax=Caloramator sp. mosi_1 TaxID=3023090 RepID=UPI002362D53C|nr:SH3 domain-containing protein [Caloramator sp. mosi_1]WDC84957.1 SH3 domain-containing protein [Caloramator sp. mosi_1]
MEQNKKEEVKNSASTNTNKTQQTKIVSKKYGYVTISRLNFRQRPTTKSRVLFVLPRNTKVEILESQNGWYKIKYNNKIAYVYAKYIRISK